MLSVMLFLSTATAPAKEALWEPETSGRSLPSAHGDRRVLTANQISMSSAYCRRQALAIVVGGCWIAFRYLSHEAESERIALEQQRLAYQQASVVAQTQHEAQALTLDQQQRKIVRERIGGSWRISFSMASDDSRLQVLYRRPSPETGVHLSRPVLITSPYVRSISQTTIGLWAPNLIGRGVPVKEAMCALDRKRCSLVVP
jgi:hypothetical protein